ncbi:MAG: hypothetical protein GTO18_04715 [Anaerolineales bacterium]|nr:hypothetical protein [Anaerolineales bacterium]
MRLVLLSLLLLSIILSACTPPPEEPVKEDNLDVFLSEGDSVVAEVNGHMVSIVLDPNQELDTSGVIVTLVNLRTVYLIETADPNGRYLPSVQVVERSDEENEEVEMPQVQADEGWSIHLTGSAKLRMLQEEFLGRFTVGELNETLEASVPGRGINMLVQIPQFIEGIQEFDVYRTPGTMTFLILGQEVEGGSGGLLSTTQSADPKLAAVSMKVDTLRNVDPIYILQKAQTLVDGVYVAQVDPTPDPDVTAEETPVLECADDEVLNFREENGETIAECQKVAWLDITPVPTATSLTTPTSEAATPTDEPPPTEPPPTEPPPTEPPPAEPTATSSTPSEETPPPTPSEEAPPPTPTPIPFEYSDSFPEVDPAILGDCPAHVHNWYAVAGPDDQMYRTWHPITVSIDPSIPDGPTCSFAHEHGDPLIPDAPQPYFGYVAYQARNLDLIKEHQAYKVFSHKKGQLTGWDTPESVRTNPDFDMQIWVHMGTFSEARLTEQFHGVGFWSRDAGGRDTEVYYFADTGKLTDKCGHQGVAGATRAVASECDYGNELWDFGGNVGNAWSTAVQITVLNPMNFMRGNPNFLQSLELINTSEVICGVNFFECAYKLPFGAPGSLWLGNMRMVQNIDLQWSNGAGTEYLCTDVYGDPVSVALCAGDTRGHIQQRVASINFYGGKSGTWDRTSTGLGDLIRLPLGAPGGN